MVTETKPREKSVIEEPKFIDSKKLTTEQLTDPDYRLKQVAREAGMKETDMLVCSKCHHCRR